MKGACSVRCRTLLESKSTAVSDRALAFLHTAVKRRRGRAARILCALTHIGTIESATRNQASIRGAFMPRTFHPKQQLEQIVLLALRSTEGCEAISRVQIDRVRVIGNDPSWDVSSIEPTLGDPDASFRALRTITGLRRDFEMAK
jgi:hypothetical protein